MQYLTTNQPFNLLVLISYIKKQSSKSSYRGFLDIHYNIIVSLLATASITSDKWNGLDITWSRRFLDEARGLLEPNIFDIVKEKVRLVLFCKVWVTPSQPPSWLSENYCVLTSGNQSR